jgi:hypothetical protein
MLDVKSPMRSNLKRLASPLAVLLLAGGLAGCQWLAAPWLMWGPEVTKTVPAEYPYLAGKKACVLVWAEMDTLFVYPHVQLEVAEHVAYAMQGKVEGVSFTPNRTREPDSPHLYRGRISANVSVYDTAYPNSEPAYRTVVETVYPPDSVGQWGSSDNGIRLATMQLFAEEVAGKFYDRKVKVR